MLGGRGRASMRDFGRLPPNAEELTALKSALI